jgi:hypothetical protein
MRIALIPPTSLLYMVADKPLHMVIPDGLKSQVYKDFYNMIGIAEGKAIMLDNGAFESEGAEFTSSHEQLFNMTREVNADVVVLPDKIGDAAETQAKARNYMHFWEMYHATQMEPTRPVHFMGVVQGQDWFQLQRSIEGYLDIEEEFETTLILGLPRWITEEVGAELRIRLAEYINEQAPHPVHLLGLSRRWPEEVQQAALIPSINSIDTSAPFVWACEGRELGKTTCWERPSDYFNIRIPDLELVRRNIDVLEGWASGQA